LKKLTQRSKLMLRTMILLRSRSKKDLRLEDLMLLLNQEKSMLLSSVF